MILAIACAVSLLCIVSGAAIVFLRVRMFLRHLAAVRTPLARIAASANAYSAVLPARIDSIATAVQRVQTALTRVEASLACVSTGTLVSLRTYRAFRELIAVFPRKGTVPTAPPR